MNITICKVLSSVTIFVGLSNCFFVSGMVSRDKERFEGKILAIKSEAEGRKRGNVILDAVKTITAAKGKTLEETKKYILAQAIVKIAQGDKKDKARIILDSVATDKNIRPYDVIVEAKAIYNGSDASIINAIDKAIDPKAVFIIKVKQIDKDNVDTELPKLIQYDQSTKIYQFKDTAEKIMDSSDYYKRYLTVLNNKLEEIAIQRIKKVVKREIASGKAKRLSKSTISKDLAQIIDYDDSSTAHPEENPVKDIKSDLLKFVVTDGNYFLKKEDLDPANLKYLNKYVLNQINKIT